MKCRRCGSHNVAWEGKITKEWIGGKEYDIIRLEYKCLHCDYTWTSRKGIKDRRGGLSRTLKVDSAF